MMTGKPMAAMVYPRESAQGVNLGLAGGAKGNEEEEREGGTNLGNGKRRPEANQLDGEKQQNTAFADFIEWIGRRNGPWVTDEIEHFLRDAR